MSTKHPKSGDIAPKFRKKSAKKKGVNPKPLPPSRHEKQIEVYQDRILKHHQQALTIIDTAGMAAMPRIPKGATNEEIAVLGSIHGVERLFMDAREARSIDMAKNIGMRDAVIDTLHDVKHYQLQAMEDTQRARDMLQENDLYVKDRKHMVYKNRSSIYIQADKIRKALAENRRLKCFDAKDDEEESSEDGEEQ